MYFDLVNGVESFVAQSTRMIALPVDISVVFLHCSCRVEGFPTSVTHLQVGQIILMFHTDMLLHVIDSHKRLAAVWALLFWQRRLIMLLHHVLSQLVTLFHFDHCHTLDATISLKVGMFIGKVTGKFKLVYSSK